VGSAEWVKDGVGVEAESQSQSGSGYEADARSGFDWGGMGIGLLGW